MQTRLTLRRLFQFRLRTLLALVLLVSVALAVFALPLQRRSAAIRFYKSLGAGLTYSFDRPTKAGPFIVKKEPDVWGPKWLRSLLGEEYFQEDPVSISFEGTKEAIKSEDLRFLPRLKAIEFVDVVWWQRTNLPPGRKLVGCPEVDDEAMAHLAKLPALRGMNLYNTSVTDAGLQSIAECRELVILGLRKSKVTDKSVDVLAGFTKLEMLDVRGTLLSAAGITALKKALPQTRVIP